jgi:hypothetical protein
MSAISAGSSKDACVLILSPSREMKFLNIDDAREELITAVGEYELRTSDQERTTGACVITTTSRLIRLRTTTSEGPRLRRGWAGSREGASHRGLGNDKYFVDLEHKALAAALGKCSDIRDVLEGDNDPTNQVQQLGALVAGELESLRVALSGRPLLPAT